MRLTTAEYLSLLVRMRTNGLRTFIESESEPPVDRESKLHDEILERCRIEKWFVVHSRMDRATGQAAGVPDFIIALPGGRTVWLEAKARNAKPTPDQQAVHHHLRYLGHAVHVVRNMADVEEALQIPVDNTKCRE